jgi:glycosyltransferase involved in cell wall biosynthesis
VAIVSYGGAAERRLTQGRGAVEVLTNRWGLGSNLYSLAAPLLHRRALREAAVFKSHQLNGAWTAAIAKRIFRKQLVVRCGFVWSDFVGHLEPRRWRRALARRLEGWVVRSADRVVVATDDDRYALIARYGIEASKTRVVPNGVDLERFRPDPGRAEEPGRVCSVGRLVEQKDPLRLLEALAGLPGVRLTLIGDGPLRPAVERRARALGLRVDCLGTVPHEELPSLLNRASVFVLPSRYEGHPKALLEAMACGLAVVGTDVPGIRGLIEHGRTGLLCEPTVAGIRAAVAGLLEDASLRAALGGEARRYVERTCALPAVVEQELAVLADLSEAPVHRSAGA